MVSVAKVVFNAVSVYLSSTSSAEGVDTSLLKATFVVLELQRMYLASNHKFYFHIKPWKKTPCMDEQTILCASQV